MVVVEFVPIAKEGNQTPLCVRSTAKRGFRLWTDNGLRSLSRQNSLASLAAHIEETLEHRRGCGYLDNINHPSRVGLNEEQRGDRFGTPVLLTCRCRQHLKVSRMKNCPADTRKLWSSHRYAVDQGCNEQWSRPRTAYAGVVVRSGPHLSQSLGDAHD